MIVLGGVLEAGPGAVADGTAFVTVLVLTGTTYLAHVLAHDVAQWIGRTSDEHRARMRDELVDALPILVSGLPPAALLAAGAEGWIEAEIASAMAAAVLVVRLAMISGRIARFSGQPASPRTFWSGIALAAVGTVIAAAKVVFGH